jgi:hypothetical protein
MLTKLQVRVAAWWARRRARELAADARAEPPDTGIGAEAPIRKTSEDRLRRADFADRIATVLSELSPREGRVFAIRGGWGFGKSSLKNLIAERLDAKKGADWLDFNPWQWGDGDTITRALFSQMADRLGSEHSKSALARAEALRRYGAILTGSGAPIKEYAGKIPLLSTWLTNAAVVAVATAVGFQLPSATKVAAALAIAAVGVPLFGRALSFFGRDRTKDSLDQIREALEKRLRDLGRPLVVFVDDIDRLEPDQIRMLLRQVKANANLPNIVFVLLFQPSIVERALDPVADGDGRAFLEKIVQASFDLPAVPVSMVHRLFYEELDELVGPYATEENGFSRTRWGNASIGCIQPVLRNLRDARRLISSIAVHVPLHRTDNVFEVNIVDFLILEALRVFEPDLHAALFKEKGLLLQELRFGGAARREADEAAAKRLLELVGEQRRGIVRDALKDLFPPLEWAYGGSHYAEGSHLSWLATKRVCTERYFPQYFELQTAPGEMSESRFMAFLDATATEAGLAGAIAAIEADNLLSSLVARLDESVDRLPVQNRAVLLPGMFVIAQKFAGQTDDGFWSSPWISAWRATNWYLKRIPQHERRELTLEALRRTQALSVAATLIYLSDPAARRDGDGSAFDPALDLDTVEALKTEWLRLIRSRAADGDALCTEPDLIKLLYRWKDYTQSLNEPRHWVAEAVRTDQGFASMATGMMSRGTSHTAGDRVSTPRRWFNKETIDDFIGIDVARLRCDAIDTGAFPEHEEALRALKGAIDEWTEQAGAEMVEQHAGAT